MLYFSRCLFKNQIIVDIHESKYLFHHNIHFTIIIGDKYANILKS